MNHLRLRCHLPTVQWMKKRGKKTCCMKYDLFWLGDHHMAVHKYAWNTLVNAGQNGCAFGKIGQGPGWCISEHRPIVMFGTK